MSEFKLQHFVAELLDHFGGNVTPEKLVDILQKSINASNDKGCYESQLPLQSYIQRISENLKSPNAFQMKFGDLQQKNVDRLGNFLQLIHQISQDSSMKQFLRTNKPRPSTSKTTTEILTTDDLPMVKNRIKSVIDTKKSQKDPEIQNLLNPVKLSLSCSPSMISWVQRRPNMSMDFSSHNLHSITSSAIPIISQEAVLIDDLLNVLIGLVGYYVEPEDLKDVHGARTFRINDSVPLPLQELVKQILPFASHYSIIQRFTEEKVRFEFGQVNNALAEAMGVISAEHLIYITQLESEFLSGNLSLQKLWFHLQKRLQTMCVTANIASIISKSGAKGGKVLSLLHDSIIDSIGDDRTQQTCVNLMEAACVPYMKMLGMWIYRGIISDPINEFLVEDNEVFQKEDMPVDYSADYWDKKYAIRRERIPKFLESVSDIILKAGKYLNVIRQCDKPVKNKIQTLQYKIEEKHLIEAIESAYKFASQTLLDLVLKEKDLIGRLKSVKHYFLLDQGDFIVTFLSLCEKELNKNVVDVVQARFDTLLDLALRLSSAINDPYKEDLKTILLPYNLQFQMFKILSIQTKNEPNYRQSLANFDEKTLFVIDSFSFNYQVRWPLSLILNRKSLGCYQMIFRHLFYCKFVERQICQVWKANKCAKKFHKSDAQHYRNTFALRQRMLHCVQNLEYHMMVEVVEPHWCMFLQKIAKVNNVDEILACHCDFLDNCLKDCMLTIPPILSTIMKLLQICVDFCKFMQQTQRYYIEAELDSLPNSFYESYNQNEAIFTTEKKTESVPIVSFKEHISLFDVQFSAALMKLLDQINDLNRATSEHDRLFNLLYRLDFNSFYSGQFEKMGLNKLKINCSG